MMLKLEMIDVWVVCVVNKISTIYVKILANGSHCARRNCRVVAYHVGIGEPVAVEEIEYAEFGDGFVIDIAPSEQ